MRLGWVLCPLVLVVSSSDVVTGQVLGPELEPRKPEIGYARKWFHRRLEPHYPEGVGADWRYDSFFARYGVNRWITLSAEGAIGTGETARFPDRDYRNYIIGAGATVRLLAIESFRIALAFHYHERFGFDRSEATYHKDYQGVVGTIQAERTFSLCGQAATVWFAPAYVLDSTLQYPWGSHKAIRDESVNNLGLVLGANLLLFKHVEPFLHIVYADFFQPRLGIGYQF